MSRDRETAIIRQNPSGKRPDQAVGGRFTPEEWRALRAVALGRAIDLAWKETLREMFKQHVPETIKSEMRIRPGVVYAVPNRVRQMPDYWIRSDREGRPDPVASVGAVAAALCRRGVLDEKTARASGNVSFVGLELKGSQDRTFKLCARFADRRHPGQAEGKDKGFFVYDERAAIWKAYGEKSEAPSYEPGTVPTHIAVVAKVSAEDGNIKAIPLKELSALMRPVLTLQPVGSVLTDLEGRRQGA